MKLLLTLITIILSLTGGREYFAESSPFFCKGCAGDDIEYGGGCSIYCLVGPSEILSNSELDEINKNTYLAQNAHDFDVNSCWAYRQKGNEKLTYIFNFNDENIAINALSIFNGYYKSQDLWEKNGRIKKMTLYINGVEHGDIYLLDQREHQIVSLENIPFRSDTPLILEFEIIETYKGSKYDDICLTELTFQGIGHH
ncbi:hypothetical protein KFE94_07560 [bacterium SCSIO 12643]|nr:hypothetical protein KFE94_07560 [bacterium SCSIO 12643]